MKSAVIKSCAQKLAKEYFCILQNIEEKDFLLRGKKEKDKLWCSPSVSNFQRRRNLLHLCPRDDFFPLAPQG